MAPRSKLHVIHPVHGYKIKPQEDIKTIKRNARERNRVQNVNRGFDELKKYLPGAANQKLSKVNIINRAANYIQHLANILNIEQDEPEKSTVEDLKKSANANTSVDKDVNDKENINNDSGYTSVIKKEDDVSKQMPLSPAFSDYSSQSEQSISTINNTPLKENQLCYNSPYSLYHQHHQSYEYHQSSQLYHSTPLQKYPNYCSNYPVKLEPQLQSPQLFSQYSPYTNLQTGGFSPYFTKAMPQPQAFQTPDSTTSPLNDDDDLLEAIADWQQC